MVARVFFTTTKTDQLTGVPKGDVLLRGNRLLFRGVLQYMGPVLGAVQALYTVHWRDLRDISEDSSVPSYCRCILQCPTFSHSVVYLEMGVQGALQATSWKALSPGLCSWRRQLSPRGCVRGSCVFLCLRCCETDFKGQWNFILLTHCFAGAALASVPALPVPDVPYTPQICSRDWGGALFAWNGLGGLTLQVDSSQKVSRVAQRLLMLAATLGGLSIVPRWMMLQWCRGTGLGGGESITGGCQYSVVLPVPLVAPVLMHLRRACPVAVRCCRADARRGGARLPGQHWRSWADVRGRV